jgi:mannosyl-oligosaccharide glucosidase
VPPHPGELHIDALSWVGVMATSLGRIADYIGHQADRDVLAMHVRRIKGSMNDVHWSSANRAFCDTTIVRGKREFVCEKGYISLFPFVLGLIGPNDGRFGDFLNLIADSDELWSAFGIRSLSCKSSYYGKDENYWRGPIWININYLIIKRLLEVCGDDSLMQSTGLADKIHQRRSCELYTSLRLNVVDAVFKSWSTTNFAWEQYNPETGAGQRTQNFAGWTSLVANIMAMPDVGIAKDRLKPMPSDFESRPRWVFPLKLYMALVLFYFTRRRLMLLWRRMFPTAS